MRLSFHFHVTSIAHTGRKKNFLSFNLWTSCFSPKRWIMVNKVTAAHKASTQQIVGDNYVSNWWILCSRFIVVYYAAGVVVVWFGSFCWFLCLLTSRASNTAYGVPYERERMYASNRKRLHSYTCIELFSKEIGDCVCPCISWLMHAIEGIKKVLAKVCVAKQSCIPEPLPINKLWKVKETACACACHSLNEKSV